MFREIKPQEIKDNPFELIGKEWLLVAANKDGKSNAMTASWARRVRPSRLPASRTLHRSSPCSTPTCRWTPRDTPSNNRHSVQKSAMKQKNCAVVVFL